MTTLLSNHLPSNRQVANTIHHKVVESFSERSHKLGITTLIKKEDDVEPADVIGKDLVIAIGNPLFRHIL